jgi:hypothetical protein
MKRVMLLLVAGLLAFGTAGKSASASTFDLGTLDPGTTTGFVANFGSGISEFDDTINFSLVTLQAELTGAVSDILDVFGVPVDSLSFTMDLFSATDPAVSLGTFGSAAGAGFSFSYLNLAAGDYFFRIRGETSPNGNAYSYRFQVNEVPLPPALLLFATALGGMAWVGARKRKAAAGA